MIEERLLEPQLLLTDIVMPGVNGLSLAARAHHIRPSLPVIFMTGFADEYQAQLSGSVCLRKPFKAAELITAIEDVIGRPRRAEGGTDSARANKKGRPRSRSAQPDYSTDS